MTKQVDIRDLPAVFSELIFQAQTGTEVIVTDGAVPRAKLIPLSASGLRVPGLHAGAYEVAEDFDAPLPDAFWAGNP